MPPLVRALLTVFALGGLFITGAMVSATPQPAPKAPAWVNSAESFGPAVVLQEETVVVVGVVTSIDPERSDGRPPILDLDVQETLRGTKAPLTLRALWTPPFPSRFRCGARRDTECGAPVLRSWSMPKVGTRLIIGLERYGHRTHVASYPRLGWNPDALRRIKQEIDEFEQQLERPTLVKAAQVAQIDDLAQEADSIALVRLERTAGKSRVKELVEPIYGQMVDHLGDVFMTPTSGPPGDGKYVLFVKTDGSTKTHTAVVATAKNLATTLSAVGVRNP